MQIVFFQTQIGDDWYTVSREEGDQMFEISRQGMQDYERYWVSTLPSQLSLLQAREYNWKEDDVVND